MIYINIFFFKFSRWIVLKMLYIKTWSTKNDESFTRSWFGSWKNLLGHNYLLNFDKWVFVWLKFAKHPISEFGAKIRLVWINSLLLLLIVKLCWPWRVNFYWVEVFCKWSFFLFLLIVKIHKPVPGVIPTPMIKSLENHCILYIFCS